MKTYIKFLLKLFFNSILYVLFIMSCLIIILNVLSEIEFFKIYEVASFFPIYLALLNTPSLIFEMFPFIFLISTQVFFVSLFNNNEIQIFKYSGLKNTSILMIISSFALIIGIFIITIFYNSSSNLKNFYIKIKSNYTTEENHLAVITKNGLWIKNTINDKITIVNASKIDNNFLLDVFITEFDKNYNVERNIKSEKVDTSSKEWLVFNPKVYQNNEQYDFENLKINSNFDYEKIQNLFSNLSSLSLIKLIELRKNYKQLNYSTTEVNIQILKIMTYPIYFVLMTILSAIIMFNTKSYKSTALKISVGLFFSVIIYYLFNFFYILGNIEKISLILSICVPLLTLSMINFFLLFGLNEK
ncbi:MAG: permease [Pelagibacteraceae bacterium BACL5 MAG-121015-bin10]|jgi:lipopolysaccharide export system permease protein|nr:MAG: permease [Pelagibacteraceae bacterium BACL5 MAG-121015-bin10]